MPGPGTGPRPGGWETLPYTMGTGSFPRVKRPGRGIEHPPLSSAEGKERVELYLYSPSGPSWPFLGWTLPFTFTLVCGVISFGECILTYRSKVLPPSAMVRQPKKKLTYPLSRRCCQFLDQCFSTAGPRLQLYRAARSSPGICHFSFLSNFRE